MLHRMSLYFTNGVTMRLLKFSAVLLLMTLLTGALFLEQSQSVEAGVYNYNTDTIYKEIWVDHKEFTGGCPPDERPNGSWYVEPARKNVCVKVLDFQLPADFAKATKIELFMDIWRGDIPPNVGFSINNGPEHYSPVGHSWGRTPLIQTINSSEFLPGANTITIWNVYTAYHLHDMAFRLYYNANDPLAGQMPPNAQLLSIKADNGTFAPGDGGALDIDSDKLTLTAGNVSANAKYIEFHAYYEGYDEDNDGLTRDWHNRTRNNCHPGGWGSECTMQNGTPIINLAHSGTTDHIGTVTVDGSATYSIDWKMPHITGQFGVKFKIRVIDTNRNVRDAAGGESAPFTLNRTKAVTAFFIPDFKDAVLYAGATQPLSVTRYIDLPPDVQSYNQAYLIGSHWKNPYIKINQTTHFRAFNSGEDEWALSIRSLAVSAVSGLTPGQNTIVYEYTGGYGQFVEKPGPFIILRRTTAPGNDTTPPWFYHPSPAGGTTNVDQGSAIELYLYDSNAGVDANSIVMKVNDVVVTPELIGDKFNYKVRYQPPAPFASGATITVRIEASDLAQPVQNVMPPVTYSFVARQPAGIVSDDFNACALNTNIWTFVNPLNDATVQVNSQQAIITVPSGAEHDIWNGKRNGPRLMQTIANGDFDVIVKFESIFSLTQGIQAQGFLVGNPNDFIRFDTQFEGTKIQVYLRNFVNGKVIADFGTQKTINAQTPPAYLRITRTDPAWKFSYSIDGKKWTTFTEFSRPLVVSEISVYGINGRDNPPHTAIIDYVFNAQSPIDPEDTLSMNLPVTVVGQGTVTKDPTCGNPVTLTATPAQGWSFSNYSGAITSVQNPLTFTFPRDSQVTATFIQDHYSVTVHVVDEQGTPLAANLVTVSAPANPQGYVYNEVATLTAATDPMRPFVRWSGPTNSTNNPLTLAMQSNQVVTATFASEAAVFYPLDLNVVDTNNQPIISGGAVQVAPAINPAGYLSGTVVALTATTEPGWTFHGWSGALTGSTPSQTLTMNGAKSVTATFRQEHYPLTLLVVDQTGQPLANHGLVTVTNPANVLGYIHGETATFTAGAKPGWRFLGWSGDLTGPENSKTLTFTAPKTVIATFQQEYYTISLTQLDEQGATVDAADVVISPSASPKGYVYGEQVTITLTPKTPWIFSHWSGDLTGDFNPATLTVTGNQQISAIFGKDKFKLTVRASAEDAGVVVATPSGLHTAGASVTLTATANAGWQFAGWSGDLTGNANPATLLMDANKTVTATFSHIQYHLNVTVGGQADSGSIQVDPSQAVYFYGDEVTVRALANPGWQFAGWTITPNKPDGVDLLQSVAKVKITDNFTFTANFTLIPVAANRVFIPLAALILQP